jgi:nucleoid DNA-binding protein
MSSPTAEDVIDAFVDLLREQLEEGEAVEVPGLGTFSVEHRPSEVEESEGERQLVPPRNVVVFDPEQE